MICSDFHPFQKIADILEFQQPVTSYFSTDIIKGEMLTPDFIRRKSAGKSLYVNTGNIPSVKSSMLS